jgi:tRNA-specific 2-thiouridylase
LTKPAIDGRPRYVLSITPVGNTVRVGSAEALNVSAIEGDKTVWTGGARPQAPVECEVQVRAHGRAVPAVVTLDGDRMSVQLRQPERGIAAGQAIVAYRGDTVLGSATITHAA